MEATLNTDTPSPAQPANNYTTANAASTNNTPEQGGTFRALYMAITKTKPSHDSPHTTPSTNKPRQMICSKAHQGGPNKTPKWIITHKDPPKIKTTFADMYRARARAAAGEPPEEVTVPVSNPKQQWQVQYLGWGQSHPPNPRLKHPNHATSPPDNYPSTLLTRQEAWIESHNGHLFSQSANQSTNYDDESTRDVPYDINHSEEDDTSEFAEGGHY
jgi:hypothetical protein